MTRSRASGRTGAKLPARLKPLFWDYDFQRLSWQADRDFVLGRILALGDWESVQWAFRRAGKVGVRDWLECHRGAGLSARQLRYWELILELPKRLVDDWLADPSRQVWDRRHEAGIRSSSRRDNTKL